MSEDDLSVIRERYDSGSFVTRSQMLSDIAALLAACDAVADDDDGEDDLDPDPLDGVIFYREDDDE